MLKRFVAVTLSAALSAVTAMPVSVTAFPVHAPERLDEAPTFMPAPVLLPQETPSPTPDENARRKAKAEADTAEANARKAAADALTAEANAKKADADAITAEANAKKAASDAREAELKAEANAAKTAADARKATADAAAAELTNRQNAAKAALGLGDASIAAKATAPGGSITGDKDRFIEPQLLASAATRLASADLATRMCKAPYLQTNGKTITTVIFSNGMDKTAVGNYRALIMQLSELQTIGRNLIDAATAAQCRPPDVPSEGCDVASVPLPLVLPAITESVKSVADLVNLFRTDTEFKGQTVNVDERSVITSFSNQLLAIKPSDQDKEKVVCSIKSIFYPSLNPLITGTDGANSPVIASFRQLKTIEAAVGQQADRNTEMIAALTKKLKEQEEKVARLQKTIEDKQKEIEELLKKPQTPAVRQQLAQAREAKSKAETELPAEKASLESRQRLTPSKLVRLKRTADDLEAFKKGLADINGLLTAVDATKQTALVGLLRAERLSQEIAKAGTFLLDMRVNASGTTRIRKNIWWNAKDEHTGGVTIEANLFDNTDQLVFGAVVDGYIDYAGSGKIRRQRGFLKLDQATEEIKKLK